ncbi:Polysaccharide transporter, PST family [Vibrio jasicida]|uniref:flippase n=1 Tax=Vibrio jasicida TaxID=766224 RepID=UPI002894AD22|nr:Polysaccharide transporter, PST family [Vibrio jasicida]
MSAKKSSVWLMIEKLFSLGLSMLVTMALARYLAPSNFGQLNYLISLVALLGPLCALGLNSIITREIVNQPEKRDAVIGSSLVLRFVAAIIFSSIAGLVAWYFMGASEWKNFIVLLVGQSFQALLVFDFWIQAELLNRLAAKVRSGILLFMSVVKLVGVWAGLDFSYFVWVIAIEMALTCVGLLVIFHAKTGALQQLSFCKDEAKGLLKQSWWLFLSGMAAIIYLKIDQVMLGWLSTDAEVGVYAVAAKLSEVWYFFPLAIVTSYFPQLLKSKTEMPDKYQIQLQKLCDVLCMSALSLAILVQILAPWGVTFLFGDAYQASAKVLVVHIWAGVFIFMRALLSKWLLAENLLRFSLFTQVIGAAMNVVGNALLIPEYGAQGAAFATVIGYTSASYFALFAHPSTWPMAKVMTLSLIWPFRFIRRKGCMY